jgi:hypothetical protein
MTNLEQSILDTLNDLDAKAKAMPTADPKPNLLAVFTRLDELAAQLPKDSPRDLLHYLHNKSYEKARLWLLGREAENRRGACGH